MRTKAILTTVLLGSSLLAGVASADPIVRDHRYPPVYQQPVYEQPTWQQPTWQQPTWQQPTWQQPTWQQPVQQPYGFQVDHDGDEVQPYAYGQDPSTEYTPRSSWINLGEDVRLSYLGALKLPINAPRITTLELQAERGRTQIQQVRAQLNDGRVIVVNPSRTLDEHSPNLRIDLGASASCGVRRIVLIGRGRGQFRVLGG